LNSFLPLFIAIAFRDFDDNSNFPDFSDFRLALLAKYDGSPGILNEFSDESSFPDFADFLLALLGRNDGVLGA